MIIEDSNNILNRRPELGLSTGLQQSSIQMTRLCVGQMPEGLNVSAKWVDSRRH